MKRGLVFLLVATAVVAAESISPSGPEGGAKEAERLLSEAAERSNLRTQGASAFRLDAEIRFFGMTGGPVDGFYSLIWASPDRWLEEISIPGFSQTRVGGDGKYWVGRNANYLPLRVYELLGALSFTKSLELREDESVKKVTNRTREGVSLRCVEIRNKRGGERELCFSPATGHLVSNGSNEYADYRPLDGRFFPCSIRTQISGVTTVEFSCLHLGKLQNPELHTFAPPAGSVERIECADKKPAVAVERVHLPIVGLVPGSKITVAVFGVIGKDGKLHNLAVVQSGGREIDSAMLEALKNWRYQPATCNGVPVEEETIEISVIESGATLR